MEKMSRKTKILGKVALQLGKFGFNFAVAVYLLTPLALLMSGFYDALLPYEAAGCIALSGFFFFKSFKVGYETLKI